MNVPELLQQLHRGEPRSIGRAISLVEDQDPATAEILAGLDKSRIEKSLILGITGPPGAGKSTLTAGLIQHLREQNQRVETGRDAERDRRVVAELALHQHGQRDHDGGPQSDLGSAPAIQQDRMR